MAYTITLYTLTKRKNSTKNSGASGAVTCNCTLIDDTDLMNPIFKLELGINPINKNYCIIQDFGRKYFIEKVRSFQGFWYIECECDVLGSYKTQIGAQTFYILRAASEYDENITDAMYPAKAKMGGSFNLSGSILSWSSNHSYILGITGYSQQIKKAQTGSVTYYQMNDSALYNFIYYLMHDITQWCDIQAQGYDDPGVQEALINPIQYVVSCIALPIGMQSDWSDANRIDFGYYTWNLSGPAQSDPVPKTKIVPRGATFTEHQTITIPKHPQQSTRGKYLNCAPFSDYMFHCGPFGDIPLDPAALVDSESIYYEICYDCCQGAGRLIVSPYGTEQNPIINILNTSYAQVGVPIQLSQAIINPYLATMTNIQDMTAAESTALSTAPAIVTGFNASGVADLGAQKAKIVYDATVSKYPTAVNSGSNGSMLSFVDYYKCYLSYHYYTVVDENLAELGRPLYQNKRINTLSGYILCQGADININCTKAEGEKINQYLNSGFFYE